MPTTPTLVARAMTPSESREAALHGKRALTPILSGAISGGIVGVAWIVGIIYWLYKRHRRARRAKAAGFASYREFVDPPKVKGPFILPPDPAVLKGQAQPGQKIVLDKRHKHKHKHENGSVEEKEVGEGEEELKHAKTMPMTHKEERELAGELQGEADANGTGAYGSTENLREGGVGPVTVEDSESAEPGLVHRATAPARVPSKHNMKSARSFERNKKRDTYPPRTSVDSKKPPGEKAPEDYWYQKRSSA
ncbi:hypothetical protein V8D89_013101 [Ganoderma adspersum]